MAGEKTDVFKLPDNKSTGKLFLEYELLFLDKGNFSSNPFQVLQLQYPIPKVSLPPLPCLSNFTLLN